MAFNYDIDRIREWDKIPHVMLREALLKEKWFEGKADFCSIKNKKSFDKKECGPPSQLDIKIPYLNNEIRIRISWEPEPNPDGHDGRFAIELRHPHVSQFRITQLRINRFSTTTKIFYSNKIFYSKKIKTTISRIKMFFEVAKPIFERKNQQEIAHQKYIEMVTGNMDVELAHTPNSNVLKYGNKRSFNLSFCCENDVDEFMKRPKKEQFYMIEHLSGYYTLKEIKKFIEIIGSNPRAVAERLKG